MKISSLQYIITRPEQAEVACRAGADWVQLRLKDQSYSDWKAVALDTLAICRAQSARLIINDNAHLAGEIGADGVHLGQADMPILQARALLGPDFIVGGTANTLETILAHYRDGVNYVGLGPFRFTTTKAKLSPILGLEGYTSIMLALQSQAIALPVIAIGGITLPDVVALRQTGVYGIAVSGAITYAPDPASQTRLFLQTLLPATPSH